MKRPIKVLFIHEYFTPRIHFIVPTNPLTPEFISFKSKTEKKLYEKAWDKYLKEKEKLYENPTTNS